MEYINRLKPKHWAWLHAKLALIVWAILFVAFTPSSPSQLLGSVLEAMIGLFVLVGVFVSVTGLLRSMSYDYITSYKGSKLELAGLCIAITGPICYLIIQFHLTFVEEGSGRIALTAFAYSLVSLIAVRLVIVAGYLRKPAQ